MDAGEGKVCDLTSSVAAMTDLCEKGKAPVPKFSSFKPQPAASRPTDRGRREEKRSSKVASNREKTKEPGTQLRHGQGGLYRGREDGRSQSRRAVEEHSRHAGERSDPGISGLYTLDATGDRYTLVYGSLHKYDIPRYYRFGAGRVLGLSTAYIIDQDLSGDTKIVLKLRGATEDTSQRSHKALWKTVSKATKSRRLLPQPDETPDLERDFLPLKEHRSRKRRRVAETFEAAYISSEEEDLPNYRSIEGKAKPERDSDLETDLGSERGSGSEGEKARLRNASLFRDVNEHPDDVESWLRLVNHQENMVGVADIEGHRRFTSAEKRSIADMKVSLYEKALAGLSHTAPRDRLLLGMMEEGSLIWDQKTLLNKWKSTLVSNPGYISLWIKYLNYQQTTFSNFTYEKCRSIFLECLKVNEALPDSTKKETISLYILLRLSLFMREAGFIEHSNGLWQALLEYNFCCPRNVDPKIDRAAAVLSFSKFWESEAPRIGEEGSLGWDKANDSLPDPKSDPPIADIDTRDIFGSWSKLEQVSTSNSFLPARTLDEVQEDDPYRVVLFSDISDFLVRFSEPKMLAVLVDALLVFCHLPQASDTDDKDVSSWYVDPYLWNRKLDEAGKESPEWFGSISADENNTTGHPAFSFPHPRFHTDMDTLFGDGKNWFSTFESWKTTYLERSNSLDVGWIRRALKTLVSRMPDNDNFISYTIALEYSVNPKEAKKYARGLLKSRPSSTRLYNAYALMEARSGQISSAEKVWTTTLSMSGGFPGEENLNCVLLWHSWAWELLNRRDYERATRILLAIADNTVDLSSLSAVSDGKVTASAAEILRSKRHLWAVQDHGVTFRKPEMFSYSTSCLALLVYLTQGQELSGAMEVYENAAQRLTSQNLGEQVFLELVHQTKARLLHYHVTENRVFKPGQVREELSKSISLFPQSSLFLSLYAFNESRFRVENRVRSILSHHLLELQGEDEGAMMMKNSSTLVPHLFSIYSELHRGVSAGSTAHSARAAFEAAVSSQSGEHSALIWKLFVQFEITLNETDKAQQVFFRAIRACPWSKQMVMLAFNEPRLKESLTFDELRRIFNVLVEKGLRIHVDLEEWLEENEPASNDELGHRPPIAMPDDAANEI